MSNARYSMNMHIAAARRQTKASEELLAKLKPHLNSLPGTAYTPLPDIYVVGLASDDPAEDTSRGGPCLTENDEETP